MHYTRSSLSAVTHEKPLTGTGVEFSVDHKFTSEVVSGRFTFFYQFLYCVGNF